MACVFVLSIPAFDQSLQYAMPLLYVFGAHQAISERSLILECESGNAALPRNSNSLVNGGHMTRHVLETWEMSLYRQTIETTLLFSFL